MAGRFGRSPPDCFPRIGPASRSAGHGPPCRANATPTRNRRETLMTINLVNSCTITTGSAKRPVAERWYSEKRLGGLSRFAFAITVLNVLGHAYLGFEQSWLTPFTALAAAYGTDLTGETIEARCARRPARYRGGPLDLVKFLLPAHISGLA